jgi:hypothetical protein
VVGRPAADLSTAATPPTVYRRSKEALSVGGRWVRRCRQARTSGGALLPGSPRPPPPHWTMLSRVRRRWCLHAMLVSGSARLLGNRRRRRPFRAEEGRAAASCCAVGGATLSLWQRTPLPAHLHHSSRRCSSSSPPLRAWFHTTRPTPGSLRAPRLPRHCACLYACFTPHRCYATPTPQALYERHGFEVLKVLRHRVGAPATTLMARRPL